MRYQGDRLKEFDFYIPNDFDEAKAFCRVSR